MVEIPHGEGGTIVARRVRGRVVGDVMAIGRRAAAMAAVVCAAHESLALS